MFEALLAGDPTRTSCIPLLTIWPHRHAVLPKGDGGAHKTLALVATRRPARRTLFATRIRSPAASPRAGADQPGAPAEVLYDPPALC